MKIGKVSLVLLYCLMQLDSPHVLLKLEISTVDISSKTSLSSLIE